MEDRDKIVDEAHKTRVAVDDFKKLFGDCLKTVGIVALLIVIMVFIVGKIIW